MANLKSETLEILKQYGKKPEDIKWVGCDDFHFDPASFWRLADKEYDSGYGAPKVAEDLLVVGDNWWLERHEYDGSEWWEYKELPARPVLCKQVKSVFSTSIGEVGWISLRELVIE